MARPRKPARICRVPGKDNWYIRDGRILVSTGTSEEEGAQCELRRYLADQNTPAARSTIGPILDARLADLKAAGKARVRNTEYYHAALKAFFGGLRPDELSPAMLKQYWARRAESPTSLREELMELRAALKGAERANWIDKAPYIALPEKRPPRERFMTREQGKALLAAARPLHLRVFLILAMTTGARKGAILGLTWDRVDLTRGRVDYNDPERRITKKRRTAVPIGPEVVAALRDAKQFAQTDHVIEYQGEPIANIRKTFMEAVKTAGLCDSTQGPDGKTIMVPWVTPHVLKHSVISWLAEDRFSVDEIADLTATSRQTVLRVYRKFSPDYLSNVSAKLVSGLGLANQFAKPEHSKSVM